MAATTFSTSLNSESCKQSHSHRLFLHRIPSDLTFILFLFLSFAVLGSPSMAASEPRRCLIQYSSNNLLPIQKPESESSGRRDYRCFESVALQVKSGMKLVLKNPPRKLRLESDSSGRRRKEDIRFESDARTERISNNPPRKLRSEAAEKSGRRRRGYRRFESVALQVPSGQERISNNPPRKLRLELESRRRRRRDYRRFESAALEVPTGRTNHASNNPKSESGGRRRRYNRGFESAAHEVPSGPNPISN